MEATIYTSRKKGIKLMVLSVILVALGVYNYSHATSSFHTIMSITGIVFFGFCGAVGVWIILYRRPGLTISDTGITINPSQQNHLFTPWMQISGFKGISIANNKMIMVLLHDPEAVIDRETGNVKKSMMRFSMKYGSPYSINSGALEMPQKDLLALLNDRLAQFGQSAV